MNPLIFRGFCIVLGLFVVGCGARPPEPQTTEVFTELDPEPRPTGPEAAPATAPAPAQEAAADRPGVAVLTPGEGRSARLGAQLSEIAGWLGKVGEDRPDAGARLTIHDATDARAVEAAFAAAVESGAVGVVGLFDHETAPVAAELAAGHDLPTLMLTLSDVAVTGDGPTWRLLPTPLLVARTAAGAALARGGRRAAVLHSNEPYWSSLAEWFGKVWGAGGATLDSTHTWEDADGLAGVVRRLAGLEFDTLFVACGPEEAASLLSHLAAAGIWARRAGAPRFKRGEAREVVLAGPPEWYAPSLPRQAGRYAAGALVPVPFARETARGAAFAKSVRRTFDREATPFDALLADAVDALAAGGELADVKLAQPRSAGLRFDKRDALMGLIVLEATERGFKPAR